MLKEQGDQAFEIVKSIDSIATVAEETSASTEESAAAAEEQRSAPLRGRGGGRPLAV